MRDERREERARKTWPTEPQDRRAEREKERESSRGQRAPESTSMPVRRGERASI